MKVKYMLMALTVALAGILGGCGKTQEAAPAEQALQSYQELLKAAPAIEGEHAELQDASFDDVRSREMFGEHYDRFMVTDLNGDGIPELIASTVINFRWTPVSVFTYANGEAVLLKAAQEDSANGTFEQRSTADGAYVTFICADNHIHSMWSGMTPVGQIVENNAYVLEGTDLIPVDCEAEEGVSFDDAAQPNTQQNVAAMISG